MYIIHIYTYIYAHNIYIYFLLFCLFIHSFIYMYNNYISENSGNPLSKKMVYHHHCILALKWHRYELFLGPTGLWVTFNGCLFRRFRKWRIPSSWMVSDGKSQIAWMI